MKVKNFLQLQPLYLLGTFIPVLVFLAAFQMLHATLFLSLCVVYFFVMSLRKVPHRKYVILGVYAFILIVCVLFSSHILNGVYSLYNSITEIYHANSEYSFQAYEVNQGTSSFDIMLLLSIVSFFVFHLQHIFLVDRKSYFTSFMISALFYFPTMLYSTPQPWLLTGFLFLFWYHLLFTAYNAKHGTLKKISMKTTLFLGVCICIIISSVLIVFPEKEYVLSTSAAQTRENFLKYVEGVAYDFLYGGEEEGEVDLGRAQDRHYTGITQMVVKNKEHKQFYLKTFSGDIYADNRWKSLPDSVYQENKNIKWDMVRTWMNQQASKDGKDTSVIIKDTRADNRYALIPYYMKSLDKDLSIHYDAYAVMDSNDDLIKYQIWNNKNTIDQPIGKDFRAYVDFINTNYLTVPKDIKEMFEKRLGFDLIDYDGNYFGRDKTIATVKSFLEGIAVYTLSPGKTPREEDFVRYFLLTNKRGYCVHFATAATLIFRYYGIPARYVEGYRVDSTDYNSSDEAKVPDRNAHAWVEVFSPSQGWVPVEVTPAISSDDALISRDEEYQDNKPELKNDNKTQTPETPNVTTGGKQTLITDMKEVSQGQGGMFSSKVLVGILFIVALLITFFAQWQIRLRKLTTRLQDKHRKTAVRALYAYLLQLVLYGAQVSEECDTIAQKAAFSQHPIKEEEYQLMYHYVGKESKRCYQGLSLWTKFKLKFLKALY